MIWLCPKVLTIAFAIVWCNTTVEGQIHDIRNTIGVLTLADSGEGRDSIRFYNADGSQWYVFSFFYDDSDGKWDFPNHDFAPMAFHPDYFLLCLAVTRRDSGGYEVIVNQRTGLKKYIHMSPFLKFQTWPEHVLSVYALEFDTAKNPLRTKPNDHGPFISAPREQVVYRPAAIEGDWLRVTWGEGPGDLPTGWVRWKLGTRLLVDFFYLD
jgi:hypothetical protein